MLSVTVWVSVISQSSSVLILKAFAEGLSFENRVAIFLPSEYLDLGAC